MFKLTEVADSLIRVCALGNTKFLVIYEVHSLCVIE